MSKGNQEFFEKESEVVADFRDKKGGDLEDASGIKESDDIIAYASFDDMKLREDLLHGIYAYGFEKPSHIQQKAIVPLAQGHELLAQAQSGTGKTGAYSIGLLQRVEPARSACQALVLTPTRELAGQVGDVVAAFGQHMKVRVHVCTGGTDVRADRAGLRGAQVVVGTPGRVFDVLKRGYLAAADIRMLILDEADEMLSAGFRDVLYDICACLPAKDLQCAVFSATFAPEAMELAKRMLRAPKLVVVKPEEISLAGIAQYYVDVDDNSYKLPTLLDLFESISVAQSVIFSNSRRGVELATEALRAEQWPVSMTHSGLDQTARSQLVRDFREGRTRILLTTDLLARGLDVQGVQLVLNLDVPMSPETYLHRVGRAGRFGRKGIAISFVTRRDHQILRALEQHYATKLEPLPNEIGRLIASM